MVKSFPFKSLRQDTGSVTREPAANAYPPEL
jgi:hypothetical protein